METGGRPLSDIPAINRFLSYCRIRAVPSKTVLIHAGDVPDVLYYVVKGSAEVLIEARDDHAHATVGERERRVDDCAVEELHLVDPDHVVAGGAGDELGDALHRDGPHPRARV